MINGVCVFDCIFFLFCDSLYDQIMNAFRFHFSLQNSADKYDITFLDWQVVRCGTVAIDLSYFIFCCTDADVRKRLPELMRIYYNSLIQRIDEFGSDGQAIFPFKKLEWHMKKYAKFGLGRFSLGFSFEFAVKST